MIEGLRSVIPLSRAIANVPDAEAWPNPPHPSTSGYPPAPAEYPSGKTTLPRRSPSRSGRPEARRTSTAINIPVQCFPRWNRSTHHRVPAHDEVSNAVFVENAQQFFEVGVHRFRRRRSHVHRPSSATPRRRSPPHPGAASTRCRTSGPSRKCARTVPSRIQAAAFPK